MDLAAPTEGEMNCGKDVTLGCTRRGKWSDISGRWVVLADAGDLHHDRAWLAILRMGARASQNSVFRTVTDATRDGFVSVVHQSASEVPVCGLLCTALVLPSVIQRKASTTLEDYR